MFFVLLVVLSVVMGTILGRVGMKVLVDLGCVDAAFPPDSDDDLTTPEESERDSERILNCCSFMSVAMSLFLVLIFYDAPLLRLACALCGGFIVPLAVFGFSLLLSLLQLLPRLYFRAMERIDRAYEHVKQSVLRGDAAQERRRIFAQWAYLVKRKGWNSKEVQEFLAKHSDCEGLREFATKYTRKCNASSRRNNRRVRASHRSAGTLPR